MNGNRIRRGLARVLFVLASARWRNAWAGVTVCTALAGCEPAKQPVQPTISLRVRGTPPDATVVIDDEPLGSLEFIAARGVALPPGVHYVTVTAPGFFPWDREVVAKPGSGPILLQVALTRVPD